MPTYEYICEENGEVVVVRHAMRVVIRNWGELCYAAQIPIGDTEFEAPVRKRMQAAAFALPAGPAQLKNAGFTKLVRRDHGVYENVTATDGEKRYMKAGDPSSLPHIGKKIRD